MRLRGLLFLLLALRAPVAVSGQTRSMAQDSTLNNLEHPAGTHTAPYGTLGNVRKVGEGGRVLLLRRQHVD
jgi:hypothetical protein